MLGELRRSVNIHLKYRTFHHIHGLATQLQDVRICYRQEMDASDAVPPVHPS